jgi:EAL domain-containing protein (putative c-di-GMP-specific phosphodiesterase class I)
LLTVLRRPVAVGGSEHVVNASVGIALALHGEGDADDLLRDADVAMYAAKSAGRGGYRLFEPDMHLRAVRRLSTESALRYAIAHDELELHYQPIWSLDPQRCTGLEALVRWRHPERGLVAPSEFIPIAEQSELILEIGDWVLARACRQMQEWRSLYGEGVPSVAVNVAARQFADPTLPRRVAELLATHELPPAALGLELTETMLMEQHGAAPRTLTALRDLGVQLILDDFGTGYSSLSHLKHLPLHVLKIDRSFIAAAEQATDESILAAIITMAHSLELTVVAEGVETEEQLSMLRRLGSDFAQGFLLARPSRAPDIAALLTAHASG